MDRKPPIGKVVTITNRELPAFVEELLGDVPYSGRLLKDEERKLLASRLERYTLNAAGPIHVLRILALEAFRFTERPDLADERDVAGG